MPAPQVNVVHTQRPGFCAEHAPIRLDTTCGRAERCKPSMICVTVRLGLTLSIRLIVPATIGAAKLVPAMRL